MAASDWITDSSDAEIKVLFERRNQSKMTTENQNVNATSKGDAKGGLTIKRECRFDVRFVVSNDSSKPGPANGAGSEENLREGFETIHLEQGSPKKVIDLGEGSLALKLLRLKGFLSQGEISEEQYKLEQKRLLRVRAFGCPEGHELEKSEKREQGWICNVCEQPIDIGALLAREVVKGVQVFSCRECDWDGCGLCYARIGAKDAKVEMQTEVVNHVCPAKHVLYEFSTPNSEWACDTCRSEVVHLCISPCGSDGCLQIAQGAIMYGCRECDWDVCIECLSKQVKIPEAVQEALPKKESSLASDIIRLKQSKLAGWLTVKNILELPAYAFSLSSCAIPGDVRMPASALPAPAPECAAPVQEEEFNTELKKLLASQGKPPAPDAGANAQQQQAEGNKQETTKEEPKKEILSKFGCPQRHELKVGLLFETGFYSVLSCRCLRPQTNSGDAISVTRLLQLAR
eukprot:764685-Hanusia_phi.AAC.7